MWHVEVDGGDVEHRSFSRWQCISVWPWWSYSVTPNQSSRGAVWSMIDMIHRRCGLVADDRLVIYDSSHMFTTTDPCRSCILYRWWTVSEQQGYLLHSGYNNKAVQKHAFSSVSLLITLLHSLSVCLWLYRHVLVKRKRRHVYVTSVYSVLFSQI